MIVNAICDCKIKNGIVIKVGVSEKSIAFNKLFDQRLNFDLPQQKIYDKTKSVENNLVKIYIF